MIDNEFEQGITGASLVLINRKARCRNGVQYTEEGRVESVLQLAARLFWDNFQLTVTLHVPKNY
jgi:hypothetical protein